uniref:F-box domain-containing protein n=1 Tax=Macrostomum lignano TaxID=282301 RepID=A0A1I8G3M1_9PLAT
RSREGQNSCHSSWRHYGTVAGSASWAGSHQRAIRDRLRQMMMGAASRPSSSVCGLVKYEIMRAPPNSRRITPKLTMNSTSTPIISLVPEPSQLQHWIGDLRPTNSGGHLSAAFAHQQGAGQAQNAHSVMEQHEGALSLIVQAPGDVEYKIAEAGRAMRSCLSLIPLSLLFLACPGHASPIATERPTFRISSTERVLFVYTGNLIVAIVSMMALARILIACFGICCVGNQERFYYSEVLNHVFALTDEERERRVPIDNIKLALRCAGEYLCDREKKCLSTLSGHEFKAPMACFCTLNDSIADVQIDLVERDHLIVRVRRLMIIVLLVAVDHALHCAEERIKRLRAALLARLRLHRVPEVHQLRPRHGPIAVQIGHPEVQVHLLDPAPTVGPGELRPGHAVVAVQIRDGPLHQQRPLGSKHPQRGRHELRFANRHPGRSRAAEVSVQQAAVFVIQEARKQAVAQRRLQVEPHLSPAHLAVQVDIDMMTEYSSQQEAVGAWLESPTVRIVAGAALVGDARPLLGDSLQRSRVASQGLAIMQHLAYGEALGEDPVGAAVLQAQLAHRDGRGSRPRPFGCVYAKEFLLLLLLWLFVARMDLRQLDPELRRYLRVTRLPEVYEALLAGLAIMQPINPCKWIAEKLFYLQEVGISQIDWDSFIDEEMKPKESPFAIKGVTGLFGGDMGQPSPEMISRAYQHYNRKSFRRHFDSWLQFHLYRRRRLVEKRRILAKADGHFFQTKVGQIFGTWLEWTRFRKGRQAMAYQILQRVLHVSVVRVMFKAWHGVSLEARKTREYFERLERGDNVTEDEVLSKSTGEARDDLSLILRHLSLADMSRAACVCRAWKAHTQSSELLHKLDFGQVRQHLTPLVAKKFLAQSGPMLGHLSLAGCRDLPLEVFQCIGACRNLQDVNLSECASLTDDAVGQIVQGCPLLIYVNLSFTGISDNSLRLVAKHAENVRFLSLASCQQLSDRGLQFLAQGQGVHKLELLDLSEGVQSHLNAHCPFGFKVPQDQTFDVFNDMYNMQSACLMQEVASHCPSVEHYELFGCSSLTDDSFRANQQSQPPVLKLDKNDIITDAAFGHLGRRCPELHQLCVADCVRVTDQAPSASFANIRVLNLADCVRLSDAGAKSIAAEASFAQSLRELNLTN